MTAQNRTLSFIIRIYSYTILATNIRRHIQNMHQISPNRRSADKQTSASELSETVYFHYKSAALTD